MSSAILVEALIGHGDDAGVGVDGAEGIVGGLRLGRGEGVEDGGFADVGQADDSAVQWHCVVVPSYEAWLRGALRRRGWVFIGYLFALDNVPAELACRLMWMR